MAEATPVVLLTGFLGAGKTTLLNRVLRSPEFARTAVLLDESDEAAVDHRLVERFAGGTVPLSSGCVCCAAQGDLIRVLRRLLPRARRDEITRIVIETTGLADPVPVMTSLLRDPAIAAAYRLDGIVTVVDSVNAAVHLETQDAARRQVAVADRIVLSKTDLADAKALLPALRRLNPQAPIVDAVREAADVPGLFVGGPPRRASPFSADDGTDHAAEFRATTLVWPAPLDETLLTDALRGLASAHGERVLRVKGIVHLSGQRQPFAVHAAGHLVHPPVPLQAPRIDDGLSRLMFITSGLDRDVVLDALAAVGMPAAVEP